MVTVRFSCPLCGWLIVVLCFSTAFPKAALHGSQYRRDHLLVDCAVSSSWGGARTVTTELTSLDSDGTDLFLTQGLLGTLGDQIG